MHLIRLLRLSVLLPIVLSGNMFAQSLTPECKRPVDQVWNNAHKPSIPAENQAGVLANVVQQALNPVALISCFSSVEQTVALNNPALQIIEPARENFLTALENYSPQQQQTSSNSATAAVSPVSKVTGLPSIAEEFGGVNLSSSTSATTFQFTPATILTNLAEKGIYPVCSPVLLVKNDCQSPTFDRALQRFTISVTANTSNTTQSATGTAISTSAGQAQQGTVTAPSSTHPTFGGLGLKGTIFYTKPNASASNPNSSTLSRAASAAYIKLVRDCHLDEWQQTAMTALVSSSSESQFENVFAQQYANMVRNIMTCVASSKTNEFQSYLAQLLMVEAYEDFSQSQKPWLGAEYDFNTPDSKPAYHSVKLNLNRQFGTSVTKPKNPAKALNDLQSDLEAAMPQRTQGQTAQPATNQKSNVAQNTNSPMKQQASENTPRFTINLSLSADVYASTLPTSIPSGSRLRDFQGGLEGDYIVHSSGIPRIGNLIGDSTLALSYCYQDQTSPSILNGQPAGITFTGLPSTSTKVYTSRGIIHLGQIRYGFGTGTNVNFPIALTYSNRSELIPKPIWGMQFGLTYNLTSLFSQPKPAK